METLGLKNVNLLTKEQYDGVIKPATDELWAVETETYSDENGNWYRVHPDGWCEQGGISTKSFAASDTTTEVVTLLKPYKDTNYTATVNKVSTTTANSHTVSYSITSNTQLTLNNNGSIAGKISWETKGYIGE